MPPAVFVDQNREDRHSRRIVVFVVRRVAGRTGAPAPPYLQARSPSYDSSGWFSPIQPESSGGCDEGEENRDGRGGRSDLNENERVLLPWRKGRVRLKGNHSLEDYEAAQQSP
jgi:hypothetical protein